MTRSGVGPKLPLAADLALAGRERRRTRAEARARATPERSFPSAGPSATQKGADFLESKGVSKSAPKVDKFGTKFCGRNPVCCVAGSPGTLYIPRRNRPSEPRAAYCAGNNPLPHLSPMLPMTALFPSVMHNLKSRRRIKLTYWWFGSCTPNTHGPQPSLAPFGEAP